MNHVRTLLSHWHMPHLTAFGLLLFAGVFGIILWGVFRKKSRSYMSYMSTLPLED